jgi:hypothetical protein
MNGSTSGLYRGLILCDIVVGLAEACKGVGNPQLEAKHLDFLSQLFSENFLELLLEHLSNRSCSESLNFTRYDFDVDRDVGKLLFNLVYRSLRLFPWLFRGKEKEPTDLIVKLICPEIIKGQIAKLKSKKSSFTNLTISSSSTTLEVTCDYQFEDAKMTFKIVVPNDFPLSCPETIIQNNTSPSSSRVRTALLAAHSIFLNSCDISEAMRLWHSTLDSSFSGVEPCSICYCVMCPSDKSLPVPVCKTCKHKFHSFCLYKWFKSAANSTCPMCRALF